MPAIMERDSDRTSTASSLWSTSSPGGGSFSPAGPTAAFGPVRVPVYPPQSWEGVPTTDEPAVAPTLDRVHGFNASSRCPVVFLDPCRAAVTAGKLVVLLDLDCGAQRFVHGHTNTVTTLAYSSEQQLGASGQARKGGTRYAEVLLWCPQTLQTCATMSFHQADIEAIGFVQGGETLVTIGADQDHTLALWPTAREGYFHYRRKDRAPLVTLSAYRSGCVNGVLAAPPDVRGEGPPLFATYGSSHVKFWHSDRMAPSLESRRGAFGADGTPKAIVTTAWASRSRFLAGGIDGDIYFFEGTRAIRRLQPHKCRVATLVPLQDAVLAVYSHGICALLRSDKHVDFDISGLPGAPEEKLLQAPVVGGAVAPANCGSLLLATMTHLLRLELGSGPEQLRKCEVILSQSCKPLTSVCAHPVEPRVFTGSLDGCVRCYRTDIHKPITERSFKASSGVTCLAVSGCAPSASSWLAVGCDDGTLSVLGETSLRYIFKRNVASKRVKLTCARFSACDIAGAHPMWLAVGTDDGCIHTLCFKDPLCRRTGHSGPETVSKVATLRGHAHAIVDVSFADTLPCVHLLSVDASGQALAFDIPMARRLQSLSLVRESLFAPWTAPVGWPVVGCWAPQKAAPEGKTVLPHRHFCEVPGRSAIAVSDVEGQHVDLYPFPCPSAPSGRPPRLSGPAEPVAALTHGGFSDSLLAASGTSLFVWSWASRCSRGPAEAMTPSPCRGDWSPAAGPSVGTPQRLPRQGGVVLLETPEGRKRAVAQEDAHALLTPPRPKSSRRARPVAAGRVRACKEDAFAGVASNWPPPSPTKSASSSAMPRASSTPAVASRRPGGGAGAVGAGGSAKARSSSLAGQSHNVARVGVSPPSQRSPPSAFRTPPPPPGGFRDFADQEDGENAWMASSFSGVAPLPHSRVDGNFGGADDCSACEGDGDWIGNSDTFDFEQSRRDAGPRSAWQEEASDGVAPQDVPRGGRNDDERRRTGCFYIGGGRGGDDDLDVYAPKKAAATRSELLERRRRCSQRLSPKIGTGEAFSAQEAAGASSTWGHRCGEARRIHEDTEARARTITERLRADSVGSLLGASPQVSTSVVTQDSLDDGNAGPFAYRARDVGTSFEVEVQLPGGQLRRVLRNPLRRTLTFEGENGRAPVPGRGGFISTNDAWGDDRRQQERLVVQVPPDFDLMSPPLAIERRFIEGRCMVAVPRLVSSDLGAGGGASRRAGPRSGGMSRAAAWEEAEL